MMGDIQHLDATLAALAREDAPLRLRLGQLLEVIGRGAVFELGFSSLGAYALERCERSARWAEAARCLARRLEELPQLRQALALAKVSWSMGELLARVATPASEGRWLDVAHTRTIRQVRVLVTEAINARPEAATSGTAARHAGIEDAAVTGVANIAHMDDDRLDQLHSGSDDICTLTCTVDREDAWLFEATRCLLQQLGVNGDVAQADALLAEAQSTLLALQPEGTLDTDCSGGRGRGLAQQRWEEQVRRWRDEAETSCEENILDDLLSTRASAAPVARLLGVALAASLGIAPLEHASCTELDQQVRALTATLARHELELSVLVLRFHRVNGWCTLGYASETQYARERLGLSRSSLLARRTLALRLEKLPAVAAALGAAQIGVEAALQLVRIATPKTEAAWVERARRRTVKHLREEVAAAQTAVRLSGESDCLPPEHTEIAAFQALERAVVSGRFGEPGRQSDAPGGDASASNGGPGDPAEQATGARRPWRTMLGSLASWLEGALQMSAAATNGRGPGGSSVGRVTLRLRMSREAYRWWRGMEAKARRWLPSGLSWLRFLCLSVWHAWPHFLDSHQLGTDVAYGHIYIRDRFRCTSPVCNRRDVTPHHLQFRSAGGSDEAHNLTSACVWCHLHGIHGGRIRAVGRADDVRWELGPRGAPCVVVQGRDRMAA